MSAVLSLAARQARLQTLRDLLDTGGAAAMRFYTGSVLPPTPETATNEVLLCVIGLANPLGAVSATGNVATLTVAVPRTGNAIETGAIGWVRFVDGAGTAVLDCAVSATAGLAPVVVSDTQVYTGGELQLLSCVITE